MSKVHYQCQRCTNCCKWPGFVKLTNEDIVAISSHLGLSEWDFVQTHTRLRPHRDGLALLDQADGACIFLDGRDCRVQAVKPCNAAAFPTYGTFRAGGRSVRRWKWWSMTKKASPSAPEAHKLPL